MRSQGLSRGVGLPVYRVWGLGSKAVLEVTLALNPFETGLQRLGHVQAGEVEACSTHSLLSSMPSTTAETPKPIYKAEGQLKSSSSWAETTFTSYSPDALGGMDEHS